MQYVGAESCSKSNEILYLYRVNSESQKKTLVFPKHVRAAGFFWGGVWNKLKLISASRHPVMQMSRVRGVRWTGLSLWLEAPARPGQARPGGENTGCFTVSGGSCCCSSRSLKQMCGHAFNICTVAELLLLRWINGEAALRRRCAVRTDRVRVPSSGVAPQRADSRPRSITFYLALINFSIFTAQQGKVEHESTKKLVIVLIYIILNVTVIFFFFTCIYFGICWHCFTYYYSQR